MPESAPQKSKPKTEQPKTNANQTGQNNTIKTPSSLEQSYQFIKEIGTGSQGKVFMAIRNADKFNVAIKQLRIDSVENWKAYELFQREAKVLESIQITGVAKFYEAIECLNDKPPCAYIVQEYIRGQSLQEMINLSHRFKTSDIYDIILKLLDILKDLHSHNPPIIHRDIKPSNIMLTPVGDNEYKITIIDFGAVANPQVQGGGSTVAGTYGYMPPEQLTGHPTPASDIYSLAAVAVHLFTGISPADLPYKDFYLIFEPNMESMPPALIATLRKMLEPDAKKRLTDIPTLKKTFEKFKQDNYKNLAHLRTKTDTFEFNHRLKNVENIGQAGNVELWQELPDEQNRMIPDCYSQLAKKLLFKTYDPTLDLYKFNPPSKILIIILCSAIIAIIAFNILIDDTAFIRGFTVIAIMISLPSMISIIASIYNYYQHTREQKDIRSTGSSADLDIFYDILSNGRKTIATITEVKYEYSSTSSELIFETDKKTGIEHSLNFVKSNPSFLIRYKFNPPDDESDEDQIHEIRVSSAPENHYQPGDPLPILYILKKNVYKQIETWSMPFPIPFTETYSFDSILSENVTVSDHDIFSEVPFGKYIKKAFTMNAPLMSQVLMPLLLSYTEVDIPKIEESLQDLEHIHQCDNALQAKCIIQILEWFIDNYPYKSVHDTAFRVMIDILDIRYAQEASTRNFIANYLTQKLINKSVQTNDMELLCHYGFARMKLKTSSFIPSCAQAIRNICATPDTNEYILYIIYIYKTSIEVNLGIPAQELTTIIEKHKSFDKVIELVNTNPNHIVVSDP